jgi:WD40 repeat protein
MLWNIAAGTDLVVLSGYPAHVALSPNGVDLATASGMGLILWNGQTGRRAATLAGSQYNIQTLAFSPDGRLLATGSSASSSSGRTIPEEVRIWDVAAGRELMVLKGAISATRPLAFSPDGKALATACQGGGCMLWDLTTGRERLDLSSHQRRLSSISFAPDGRALVTASEDGSVLLWRAAERGRK